MLKIALQDLKLSCFSWRLWTLLGWIDIRQRYARSKLGPFWLTISMGVLVATLGIVYGTLFGQKIADYLPTVAIGMVLWALLSGIINDGCTAYISSAGYIKQSATPKLLFMLQMGWRNFLIFLHNFVIIGVVVVIFGVHRWLNVLIFFPALTLFLINALWMGVLVGIVSARFRDLPQTIGALLLVAFYVTPIIFRPGMLASHHWIVEYNPLAYMIELVREPLTGIAPDLLVWEVTIAMAVLGWFAALCVTGRYIRRIPYWV